MPNSPGNFPTAVIFSELDDFSFGICKQIISEKCLVKIICQGKKEWTSAITAEGLHGVEIITNSQAKNVSPLNYIIYHLNYFKVTEKKIRSIEKEEVTRISFAINLARESKAKALVLLPAQQISLSLLKKYSKASGGNNLVSAQTVFFDETIGPHFQPSNEGFFGKMARTAAKRRPADVKSTK